MMKNVNIKKTLHPSEMSNNVFEIALNAFL